MKTLKKFGEDIGLSATNPGIIASNLIRIALQFVGIAMIIMILSGGISYMFSGGDKEKIDTAKKTLFNAFIGLIIILSSYSIVAFVVTTMNSATGAAPSGS